MPGADSKLRANSKAASSGAASRARDGEWRQAKLSAFTDNGTRGNAKWRNYESANADKNFE